MFERGYQIAGELGRHVFDRVRPLPGRLVTPLPVFQVLIPVLTESSPEVTESSPEIGEPF